METAAVKKQFIQALTSLGSRERVLIIPPDHTRIHSYAGKLTEWAWEFYGSRIKAILPALGTHSPMTVEQISRMFGQVPSELFVVHNWRKDTITLGHVPSSVVSEITDGRLNFSWPVQVNRLLVESEFDLILSIGQVVPHEVAGMANHTKNVFVGTGGADGINKSHYVGAVCGMEGIMGRAETPVRKLFDYGAEHFGQQLPVYYVLTVMQSNQVAGLFTGFGKDCFLQAAELSLRKNVMLTEKPFMKVVVWLDPSEYKSTWLGNKAIYRTRMAIADQGELIILAPGLKEFGEDAEIDRLIRKFGYRGTQNTLEMVATQPELSGNLSAAAHLIHGSSENRFRIRYCTPQKPGYLQKEDIENAGFDWGDLTTYSEIYPIEKLSPGINRMNGEEFYFIPHPASGLWASKEKFIQ